MPVTPTFVFPSSDGLVSGGRINISKVLDFDKATQATKRKDILSQPGANDGTSAPAIVFNFENQQGSRYWVYSTEENRDAALESLQDALADEISSAT